LNPLGSAIGGPVYCVACDHAGTVYAGGRFTSPGNNIAMWNGSNWTSVGSGITGSSAAVDSAACDNSGNLYVGGYFTRAGGVTASCVAKWNGSNWSALGFGLSSNVTSLACDISGNVYAGGSFTFPSGIAKWNGSNWSALGSGASGAISNNAVNALAFDGLGNLYAGGTFAIAGTNVSAFVAKALLSQVSYQLSLTPLAGGTNVITGLGTPGFSYALDMAANLDPPVNWIPQGTNTLAGQSFVFTNASGSPQGFYRTRYVPQ
jgi:hypothetical protein